MAVERAREARWKWGSPQAAPTGVLARSEGGQDWRGAHGMEGRMGCADSEELREAEGKMNNGISQGTTRISFFCLSGFQLCLTSFPKTNKSETESNEV